MAGGLADQPTGYLNDVMQARSYSRAYEAVERERTSGSDDTGQPRLPAPEWAWTLYGEVELAMAAEDEDAT